MINKIFVILLFISISACNNDAVINKKYPELATCGDQKYLDAFIPEFGEDTISIIDNGVGHGAPWNWRLYVYEHYEEDGSIVWGDKRQPLVFAHFSQFKFDLENDTLDFSGGKYPDHTLGFQVFNIPEVRQVYYNYFQDINEVNIISIKLYYLKLLSKLKEKEYEMVHNYLMDKRKKKYESTIKITTENSHTLTDGPTIFITNNVEKIAKFYLKISSIPQDELSNILKVIAQNSIYSEQLEEIIAAEKERIDKQQMSKEKADKDAAFGGREEQELEFYKQRLAEATSRIQSVHLSKKYIPNTTSHIKRFGKKESNRIFTSDIDDTTVENIMLLDIPDVWKVLLLMGIGVFIKHESIRYMEIMKKLAEEQKLYLIIASSDYIYGTNYQFCHGYLTKDLTENLTQEKMLQAFGRVGRRDLQKDYSIRIRDDRLVEKLLTVEEDKIEVKNMNKLFGI